MSKCASFQSPHHGDVRNLFPKDRKECDCDGYHTFTELYDHRIALFMALCRMQTHFNEIMANAGMEVSNVVWKSLQHHPADDAMFEGSFIMGIGTLPGHQMTYHLPLSLWNECSFAQTFLKAPKWDGHTPDDVIGRLKSL